MASTLGLDLTKNLSYYTIPIATLACMVPHMVAVVSSGKVFDNNNPRNFQDALEKSTLDKEAKGRLARAQAASDNGFETIGLYAAAVVAANQAGVEASILNRLAIGYTLSRFAYVFVYVNQGGNPKTATARSAVWLAGISAIFAMFVKAGQKLNA